MNRAIKQLLPPAALSIARAVHWRRTETSEQRALREVHEQLNRDTREDEICLRPGLTLKLHPQSRAAFEAFCYRSPEMVAEMDCFIRHTVNKHSLLDVGALHGIFSLVFAAAGPSRKAVAVDPSPIAFARLLYNIHKNQLHNVVPVECALSDGHGALAMHYEWEHAVAAGARTKSSAGLCVEMRTGDELCESLGLSPDVIKIDVEGHEAKVLHGLKATIRALRPLIFLEVHTDRLREEGDQIEEMQRFFTDLDYRAESTTGEPVALYTNSATTATYRLILGPR